MNLVRVALIGVGLGLLAIGLPGSEDTPAQQQPTRFCVITPYSPTVSQIVPPLPDRVDYPPLSVYPTPAAVSSVPPSRIQIDTTPVPVALAERSSEEATTRRSQFAETEPSWVEEEPPMEEEEEIVSLVALNRPISLEPTYLYNETSRSANRSTRRHGTSRETTTRRTGPTSERRPLMTEPDQEADLEQAREKLTGVLQDRYTRAPHDKLQQAEAYPPATARFREPIRSTDGFSRP